MKKSIISFVLAGLFCLNNLAQTTNFVNPMENPGVGSLPLVGNIETRSVSPENITGEKGKGGMAVPELNNPNLPVGERSMLMGQGWKVSPCFFVKPGETKTIMDVDGPGQIQHIWIAFDAGYKTGYPGKGRAYVLRFYWDDEKEPSVEVPMADFFAQGHEKFWNVHSSTVMVNPCAGLNSYWPMPFRKHARITLTNESDRAYEGLYYQITYAKTVIPENAAYFHAQWRRATIDPKKPDYTILDHVKGKGKYVGTFLAWSQKHYGWFGEGEVKMYIDGDGKFPTYCGTGTEDYFCGSGEFPESYTLPYVGNICHNPDDTHNYKQWSLYRWHVMDPIYFQKDFKITIQGLSYAMVDGVLRYIPIDDDIASVAYWYQEEPHNPFPKFPELNKRRP